MLKTRRIKLPIALAAAVALTLSLTWSSSDARPYRGFASYVSGQVKHKADVLNGDPDAPGYTPPGGTGRRSLGGAGGSDLQSAISTRGMWVMLLWMRTIQR
jgi:hypothetical protein